MKYLFIIMGLLFTGLLFAQQRKQALVLQNRSAQDIKGRIIELSWKKLARYYKLTDTTLFALEDESGNEIPVQFESFPDGSIDKVLALVSVPAKSNTYLTLVKRVRVDYPSYVYGRYVPERKDDFAWENDKIAFRMYGKALQFTNENAHGIDVWAKRTSRLVINDWYKRNDYHKDHGEGLDFYSVGFTMGAGNIAPYLADTIFYPGNYSSWRIIEQGPLRIRFRLTYDSFAYKAARISMEKEIQLSAGEHYNKVTVSLGSSERLRIPMAVGIASRSDGGEFYYDKSKGLATYWEPPQSSHGTIGVGVAIGKKTELRLTKTQRLLVFTINTGDKMSYYAGAAWDRQGDYDSSDEWVNASKQILTRQFRAQAIKIIYPSKKWE